RHRAAVEGGDSEVLGGRHAVAPDAGRPILRPAFRAIAPDAPLPMVTGADRGGSDTLASSPTTRRLVMKHPLSAALAIALTGAISLAGCTAQTQEAATAQDAGAAAGQDQSNPLFVESPLALQYPQFDKLKDEHFAPAFDAGMAEELKEIDAITAVTEPANFENTIIALE